MKKKKLTIATLKGRLIVDDREELEAALFAFRKHYDADPERYLEDVQALLLTLQGVKASKIRAHSNVKHKLESSRTYRQRLRRLKAQFKEELSQDRINSFIEVNWNELTTIPNPHNLPGLHAWSPSVAIELMRRASVLPNNSHKYNSKWFKQRRKRLGLRPAPKFLVRQKTASILLVKSS